MKTRKSSNHVNGDSSATDLAAKAAAAQKIADVARKHFKMLKAEYKQARKAYKQARKAAKRARKEARTAQEILIARNEGSRRQKTVKKIARRTQPVQRKTQTATAIPLPSAATASLSTGTA